MSEGDDERAEMKEAKTEDRRHQKTDPIDSGTGLNGSRNDSERGSVSPERVNGSLQPNLVRVQCLHRDGG